MRVPLIFAIPAFLIALLFESIQFHLAILILILGATLIFIGLRGLFKPAQTRRIEPLRDHDEVCTGGALPAMVVVFATLAAFTCSVIALSLCLAFNMKAQFYWILPPSSFVGGAILGLPLFLWLFKLPRKRAI